jgi:hypothetical protein
VIPGEAIGWTEFDVLACDAACGAHVAMWLRDALPGAFVRSEPDPGPSDDTDLPHLLHCSARLDGTDGTQMRRLLESAVAGLDAVAGAAPRARIVFTAASHEQRRAA